MPTVTVELGSFECWKTTEKGHDEIFVIVAAQNGDGSRFQSVLPAGDGDADNGRAWDLNDSGNQQTRILSYALYQKELANGQTAKVSVSVIESDGSNYDGATRALGEALSSSNDPLLYTAGQLAKILQSLGALGPNENDNLGSFDITLTNRNGTLDWSFTWANDDPAHPAYRINDTKKDGFFQGRLRNLKGGDGYYSCAVRVHLI